MGCVNIKGEMAKRKISAGEVAELLGIHKNTAANKVNGLAPFTVDEAIKLQESYFPDLDVKYLFERGMTKGVKIGSREFSEIIVTDAEDNLLASITGENIIQEKNCKVTCVPFEG